MPRDRRCGTCRHYDEGFCIWFGEVPFWQMKLVAVVIPVDGVNCPTWEARDADAE